MQSYIIAYAKIVLPMGRRREPLASSCTKLVKDVTIYALWKQDMAHEMRNQSQKYTRGTQELRNSGTQELRKKIVLHYFYLPNYS